MHKKITFLLNQSEITAGTRGASLGPDAILTAARNVKSPILTENEFRRLSNVNELLDKPDASAFAKNIEGLAVIYNELNDKITSIIKEGTFPFIIAADHGSAGGTIAALKTAFPDKKLGVVWIDAHADIHTPYTTPTGNMHGMPLAVALHMDNLECRVNDVDAETVTRWDKLKAIGGDYPKIHPEDIVYIAIRDLEEQEKCLIDALNIKVIPVAEVRTKGVADTVARTNEMLAHCDIIYVSFDVDSMDPDLSSYGTGTPVKGGLIPAEAKEIMEAMAGHPKIVCIEVVEVNPCLDEQKNRMAEIALDIIAAVTNILKR